MFFVTVGTAPQPFQRLIKVLAELPDGIRQKIIFQGVDKNDTTFPFPHKTFMSTDEYDKVMKDAELVVCHAGIGTVRDCYELGKKTIVVPRQSKYGEHFNNHQLELVEYLLDNPLPNIYPLSKPEQLAGKILEVQDMPVKPLLPGRLGEDLEAAIAADVKEMLKNI